MKSFIVIFYVLLISSNVLSKNIQPDWNEGNVMLESEGYFTGWIFLDTKNDFLLLKKGDQIKAYPALKVKKLQVFDDDLKVYRDYITYDLPLTKGLSKKIFLEVVLLGEISIYRKEKAIPSSNLKAEGTSEYRTKHDYVYYAEVDNDLLPLSNFRKCVFPLLVQLTQEEVLQFKKENKLKSHNLAHQIILIDYCNSLQNPFYKGLKNTIVSKN
ncbi:MAG: hypothetical protein M3512_11450 [Bacteroidota bacterium]|nr:hypothetical protein [Bacteroidota bacterium]